MNIDDLKESKYLKQSDCGRGILLTITGGQMVNLAKEGDPPEHKFCLSFAETEKPLVLNSTNGQIIAAFLGSKNTEDWTGKHVVLYADPSVSYGGRVTGGIRARAPRGQATAPVPKPAPEPVLPQEPDDPSVPF